MNRELTGVEIKSASTYNRAFKKELLHFDEKVYPLAQKFLIYNGEEMNFSDGVKALGFQKMEEIFGAGEE